MQLGMIVMFTYTDVESILTGSASHPTNCVHQELGGINLGDKRLDRRALSITASLAQQPFVSLPQAMGNWAKTKAMYRFFDNELVETQKIIAPHIDITSKKLDAHKVVLAIQDTVFFSYKHPSANGLGPVGKGGEKDGRGIIMHHVLGVTPAGLPLGLMHRNIWTRDEVL